jgi:hypothetical protein
MGVLRVSPVADITELAEKEEVLHPVLLLLDP